MNELVNKAYSLEEDIKGLPLLKQIESAVKLLNEMRAVSGSAMGDMNVFVKAETHVESVWMYLVAEYKSEKEKHLKKRVSEVPYCSIVDLPDKNSPYIVEVAISEEFIAEISFKWNPNIWICFKQSVVNRQGENTLYEVTPIWKAIPGWLKSSARFTRGHFEKTVSEENWVNVIMDTAKELMQHQTDVITLCKRSINTDENGDQIIVYDKWETKGRILSLTKEKPFAHLYHAKKNEQNAWDNDPNYHGSNGTYVENVPEYWCLTVRIKRPSLEVATPIPYYEDVHEYITKTLMPKLGWGRITQERRDRLNEILKGEELKLVTYDTTEVALNRTFLPVGFKSWNDYLDSIILPKL